MNSVILYPSGKTFNYYSTKILKYTFTCVDVYLIAAVSFILGIDVRG